MSNFVICQIPAMAAIWHLRKVAEFSFLRVLPSQTWNSKSDLKKLYWVDILLLGSRCTRTFHFRQKLFAQADGLRSDFQIFVAFHNFQAALNRKF